MGNIKMEKRNEKNIELEWKRRIKYELSNPRGGGIDLVTDNIAFGAAMVAVIILILGFIAFAFNSGGHDNLNKVCMKNNKVDKYILNIDTKPFHYKDRDCANFNIKNFAYHAVDIAINNQWHDISELPERDVDVILKDYSGIILERFRSNETEEDYRKFLKCCEITAWMYLPKNNLEEEK